jgi:hypothetical protein
MASIASVPAAALTVGVQNWGDLLRRAPWWATEVALSLFAIVVTLVVAVHPTMRRLAGWTIGLTLGLVSGLLFVATLWTFVFARDAIENWRTSTVVAFMLAITSVFGFMLASRRVRDEDDPRLVRMGRMANGFLIPDDDPSIAILNKLEQMNQEIRRIRDADVEPLSVTWGGRGWLGRWAVRRGWLVSASQ